MVISVFPPEEYSDFRGSKYYSHGYIGTWKKKDAMKIVRYLRKNGFTVRPRGRGSRIDKRFLNSPWNGFNTRYRKGCSQDSCSLKAATHLAIYIKNIEIREVPVASVIKEMLALPSDRVKGILETM